MSHNWYEKWVILIIVLVVIVLISIQNIRIEDISNIFEEIKLNIWNYEDIYQSVATNWFSKDFLNNTKTKNVFKVNDKMYINSLSLDLVIEESSESITPLIGEKSKLIKNTILEKRFSKSIKQSTGCNNLVYFIKTSPKNVIKPYKLQYLHNFNNEIQEATHIIYCFGSVNWTFSDNWLLRDIDSDRYYIPENNSIICFNNNTNYEWLPLESQFSRYFVMILIFNYDK
jgi:hypothetical protein